jgi:hypothetical protein
LSAQELTDEFCRGVTAKGEYPDQEQPGLLLRVSAAGTKTWALRYREAGKRLRIHLGRYPAVTLAEARAKAKKILASNEKAAKGKASKPGPTKQQAEAVLRTLSAILHERREAWPENNWPEAEQRLLDAVDEYRLSGDAASLLEVFGLRQKREQFWDEDMLREAFKLYFEGGKTWEQIAKDVKFPGDDPGYLGRLVRAAYPRLRAAKVVEGLRRRDAKRSLAFQRVTQATRDFNELAGSRAMEDAILHVQKTLKCDRKTARQKLRERFVPTTVRRRKPRLSGNGLRGGGK